MRTISNVRSSLLRNEKIDANAYKSAGDSMEGKQYGANQDRLAHLKLKFDPKCLFDKTNVITPVAA